MDRETMIEALTPSETLALLSELRDFYPEVDVHLKGTVNTLTNERDLARRANEQNIKIIKNLRKQLRKDKQRRIDARPDPIPSDDYDLES